MSADISADEGEKGEQWWRCADCRTEYQGEGCPKCGTRMGSQIDPPSIEGEKGEPTSEHGFSKYERRPEGAGYQHRVVCKCGFRSIVWRYTKALADETFREDHVIPIPAPSIEGEGQGAVGIWVVEVFDAEMAREGEEDENGSDGWLAENFFHGKENADEASIEYMEQDDEPRARVVRYIRASPISEEDGRLEREGWKTISQEYYALLVGKEIARARLSIEGEGQGAGGWRAMESAPKDGTWIFGWAERDLSQDESELHFGMAKYDELGWIWNDHLRSGKPTMWQPAPMSPAKQATESQQESLAQRLYESTPAGKRKPWTGASKSQRTTFLNLANVALIWKLYE